MLTIITTFKYNFSIIFGLLTAEEATQSWGGLELFFSWRWASLLFDSPLFQPKWMLNQTEPIWTHGCRWKFWIRQKLNFLWPHAVVWNAQRRWASRKADKWSLALWRSKKQRPHLWEMRSSQLLTVRWGSQKVYFKAAQFNWVVLKQLVTRQQQLVSGYQVYEFYPLGIDGLKISLFYTWQTTHKHPPTSGFCHRQESNIYIDSILL